MQLIQGEGAGMATRYSDIEQSIVDSFMATFRGRLAEGKRLAMIVTRDPAASHWGPIWMERAGFEALVSDDPTYALDVARRFRPAVIMVEAGVTVAEGEALFESLARDPALAPIPRVVLCEQPAQVKAALAAEAADVVRAPYDWQLISRRVEVLARTLQFDSAMQQAQVALKKALAYADEARRYSQQADGLDVLTGLPSRHRFMRSIESALAGAHGAAVPAAVMVIGLNRFELVNESLGQRIGNRVLRIVGERLRDCLAGEGAGPDPVQDGDGGHGTVARLGGVRFGALVVRGSRVDALITLKERIAARLSQPIEVDGQSVYVTPNIGTAIAGRHGGTCDELLQRAETAMLEAKSRGSHYRFYCQRIDEAASRRLELGSLLRGAIDRDELEVFYQPIVHAGDGCIVGAEALLRWKHPEQGFISPEEFIPVAEESGLIARIGAFVLDAAGAQLRRWLDAGHTHLRMAVNVSAVQLRHSDFVWTVRDVLKRYELPGEQLELEISERLELVDDHEILHRLSLLKGLGVRLSLDDFGVGHSAFPMLRQLPVDTLKIDRSYMRCIPESHREFSLAMGMASVGRALGLTVVGEGIERPEQLEVLRAWGCDLYQGYLCSPAVPAAEFERLLVGWAS